MNSPAAVLDTALERSLLPTVGADQRVPLATGGSLRYANLDVAASAPALTSVRATVASALDFYSSVHRGAGYHSQVSTAGYEQARSAIGRFVGARPADLVVITRNTTDAVNLLATAVPGRVLVLDIEHHANLLPWRAGAVDTVVAAGTVAGTLAELADRLAATRYAALAVTGLSNVTGEGLPLSELADLAHARGARLVVDGAQLVPHRRVDLAAEGIDYLALSGHKLYAPFGAGALVGRPDWLDAAPPYLAGGGAVRQVELDSVTWTTGPARHEAGTPNVIGAIALAAAATALAELVPGALQAHEAALTERLRMGLSAIDGVRLARIWTDSAEPAGIVTFTLAGRDPAVLAAALSAEYGIGVRDGRFCAHPLLARLGWPSGAVRASIGVHNRAEDVDRLVSAVAELASSGPALPYGLDATGTVVPRQDPRRLPAFLGAGRLSDTSGEVRPCAL